MLIVLYKPSWIGLVDSRVECTMSSEPKRVSDSFPIGVSADSCPLNGLQQRCHLIRVQLVYLDFGPQTGVINKIYNLLHHVLG